VIPPEPGAYARIAFEYYDATRHPTSANLAAASQRLLHEWFARRRMGNAWICEIGPGRSLVADELRAADARRLLLVDASETMLEYSRPWVVQGACAIVGNALALPLGSDTVDVLVASLGDAYNVAQFWREAERVLRTDGEGFFSVPSYEWAAAFRGGDHTPEFALAEFELLNGAVVHVPSFIHTERAQCDLIERHGLTFRDVASVSLDALRPEKTSPKLVVVDSSCPIVTAYSFVKPRTVR
jgi:SAM-dependent methyltransferase